MTADQNTRRNVIKSKQKMTTTCTSNHLLSMKLLVFLLLAIVTGVSWPLIRQPILCYANMVMGKMPNEEIPEKVNIQLPTIGLYLAVGLSGVSILFLLAGAIYTSTGSWHAHNNDSDDDATE